MKYIYTLISIIFFISCNINNKKIETENNKKIIVKYYKGEFETFRAIPCGSIMQKKRHFGIKDTFISNSKAYEEIIYKIKRLKSLETTHFSFDNRIEARINLNSGDSFQLCIALFNGIMLNGKFMGENDSLAYLIKANSGYYNYFQKERLYSLQEISKFGIPNNYKNWIRIQDPNKPQFSPNEIWLN